MTTFVPVETSVIHLKHYHALFVRCFGKAGKFTTEALRWLYSDNPDGQVVGWDAWDGDQLCAHYACIPAVVRLHGVSVRALLSLNTATHPAHQGKGLFTQLAQRTYQDAAERGYECVYGVANANSTPGFVRKLGFQLVEPLRAMVGVGALGVNLPEALLAAQFERVWTAQSLRWRCDNPVNPVTPFRTLDRMGFHARALGNWLPAYAERLCDVEETHTPSNLLQGAKPNSPFRLYLGLMPGLESGCSRYFDIPNSWRPSPLNLIFRPLSGGGARLEAGQVGFSFLDFDAY